MTNLPQSIREELRKTFDVFGVNIEKKLVSQVDNTVKYLYALRDGETVESVLMQYRHGWSQCLSTQVGCKMGCVFCGMGGFVRNLTASEMLAQVEAAQEDNGIRVSSVVLMGMGEPLDNYQNVLRFLELVSSDEGMNIGMRHISLSTCGIVDKIYDLAERKLQLTLSVSLHAPNDAIRSQTMPVNNRWGVDELLTACRAYAETTGRRISFEYAMISGVNDTAACAKELATRLHGMLCHVNLIPVNEVKGNSYRKSSNEQIQRFIRILSEKGITATVRRTLGSDINASCGQLRRRYQEEVANVADLYEN